MFSDSDPLGGGAQNTPCGLLMDFSSFLASFGNGFVLCASERYHQFVGNEVISG